MNVRRMFYCLLGCALATTWVALGVYIYKFGSITNPTLSGIKDEWGTFGDFIGGTLGTYFGFLAFIGVLFTVLLQHDQLEHMRSQAKLEEIQRFVASIAARIDEIMHSAPKILAARLQSQLQNRPMPIALHGMLAAAASIKLGHSADKVPAEAHDMVLGDVMESLRADMPMVVIELQNLVLGLQFHRSNGGSEAIEMLYRKKYETQVCWMHVTDTLCSPMVEQYFKPEEVAAIIRNQRS